MTNLSQVVQDERTARMLLSMIVEPDDAVTGRLLAEQGALEVLRLAERDEAMLASAPLTLRCGVPSSRAQTLGRSSSTSSKPSAQVSAR